MASHSCGHAPEQATYTLAYNKAKDETDIHLRADREVLSLKAELITCGGRQSMHVISSGKPHPGHGMFEPWGKGHFPSMEESEQLKIWRDKNFEKAMNKVICTTPPQNSSRCQEMFSQDSWPQLVRLQAPLDESF